MPNGNYLWINLFATSLKPQGRAALVMANSASDARHSEADIRKKLIEQNLIYAMLTLPSNMFYTVTLPATLWFFDKAKSSNRILFIDARNIFTQIDRTHRKFSEEQIQNIAVISHLHKGRREKFVQLIDRYFATGIEQLLENNKKIESVYAQLLDTPNDADGKQAVNQLLQHWSELNKLKIRYQHYLRQNSSVIPNEKEKSSINAKNQAQRQLYNAFDPFFTTLHEDLKRLDKTLCQHEKQQSGQAFREDTRTSTDRRKKALKSALEELHQDVNNAEIYFQHIHWLQERFPNAAYEDVIGLCKLACPRRNRRTGLFAESRTVCRRGDRGRWQE